MTPTIHFIRHAEGTHNLSVDNHGMHDPGLTEHGREQAQELGSRITKMQEDTGAEFGLVLASALRRTLMTALTAFAPQLERKQPAVIYAWPDVQEVSDLPCDSGSPVSAVRDEFGSELVNFDKVSEGWELKQGKHANSEAAVGARARNARQWLKNQPHKDIAVVSHGCMLHFLTEDWEGSDSPTGTDWEKTELRSYTFSDDENDEAALIETQQSRERRGCATKLPSLEEQKRLREGTIKMWTEWEVLK